MYEHNIRAYCMSGVALQCAGPLSLLLLPMKHIAFTNPCKILQIIGRKDVIFSYFFFKQINGSSYHYENTPLQYTEIFQGCKNYNFQIKTGHIFLIFDQNIDFGYTLEPPH